ncbi:B12-binding domain-containing radical SAM protein [Methanopyrus kandleri]
MAEVVLTMDRTLASNYRGGMFMGFSACVPKGIIPDWLYFSVFCPSVEYDEETGEVKEAPLGIRRIEAQLRREGYDVAVVHPDAVHKAIDEDTIAVGVSEIDPQGMGPATTTFTSFSGKPAYMKVCFEDLMERIRELKDRYGFGVFMGGPGAWQVAETFPRFGVDFLIMGEGEYVVGEVVRRIEEGDRGPEIVRGEPVAAEDIPTIVNPTTNGIVEVARGCGRGCKFCSPDMRELRSFPMSKILEDVDVNVRGGHEEILLHAEDVLRYKADGWRPNVEAVLELFSAVMNRPGVKRVSVSHVALSTVCQFDERLGEISEVAGVGELVPWMGAQVGVETGSPRLMAEHMPGKVAPYEVEEWPDVVEQAFGIMNDHGWVPCGTLILGLPGETEDDVMMTVELLDRLRDYKSFIVPLFFVPIGESRLSDHDFFTPEKLTEVHWEVILKCVDHDLKWLPELYEEYARANGHGPLVKLAIRALTWYGRRKIFKSALKWCSKELVEAVLG